MEKKTIAQRYIFQEEVKILTRTPRPPTTPQISLHRISFTSKSLLSYSIFSISNHFKRCFCSCKINLMLDLFTILNTIFIQIKLILFNHY